MGGLCRLPAGRDPRPLVYARVQDVQKMRPCAIEGTGKYEQWPLPALSISAERC